jgi:uncharacterized membrane protein HdeD (DUF308 family)
MNPFSATVDDIDRVSRGWWVLLVSGLVSAVAGGIILSVDWELDSLATFIGAVLIARGIVTMFNVPIDGSRRGWAIASGLLEVALGVMVWAWPEPTLLVIAFSIGWYVLFSGIVNIAGAVTARDVLPYWGFALAYGIIEVLLAFWLLGRPNVTLVAAVLALGLWCVLSGAVQIVLAFDVKRARDHAHRLDLGLSEVSRTDSLDSALR